MATQGEFQKFFQTWLTNQGVDLNYVKGLPLEEQTRLLDLARAQFTGTEAPTSVALTSPTATSIGALPQAAVDTGIDFLNRVAPAPTVAQPSAPQAAPMVTPGQIPMGPMEGPPAGTMTGNKVMRSEAAGFEPFTSQDIPLVQQMGVVPGMGPAGPQPPMGGLGPMESTAGPSMGVGPDQASAAGPSRGDKLGGMFLAGSGLQAFGQGVNSPSAAEPLGALGMTVAGVGKMLGAGAWTTPVAIGATLLNMFGQMQAGGMQRDRRRSIYDAYANALKSAGRIYRG